MLASCISKASMNSQHEQAGSARRSSRRQRRFPPGAQCSVCHKQTDIHALVDNRIPPICRKCDAINAGRRKVEKHHTSGRKNSTEVIDMPVNEHSILSDAQNDWPDEMLTNPNSNPLAGWAASVQGKIETLMLWLKQA